MPLEGDCVHDYSCPTGYHYLTLWSSSNHTVIMVIKFHKCQPSNSFIIKTFFTVKLHMCSVAVSYQLLQFWLIHFFVIFFFFFLHNFKSFHLIMLTRKVTSCSLCIYLYFISFHDLCFLIFQCRTVLTIKHQNQRVLVITQMLKIKDLGGPSIQTSWKMPWNPGSQCRSYSVLNHGNMDSTLFLWVSHWPDTHKFK